nr:uncharacterized protein LOC128698269 [Cherax quadricarinatus]
MDAVSCTPPESDIPTEWAAKSAKLEFFWEFVGQAGNVPLDITQSILADYKISAEQAVCSGIRCQTGGYIQCPKCSTPWIAGFCRSRLLGCPRNAHKMKTLLKKERRHPKKLTSKEKMQISSFRLRKNSIEVSCLICKYKMRELCSIPVKEKPIDEAKPEVIKKKKKKKRVKEVNAGLLLSSSIIQNDASLTPKAAPVSTITSQESNLRVKNKKRYGKFLKINSNENRSVDFSCTDDKILHRRLAEITTKSSHSSQSKSGSKSFSGSKLGSGWESSNIEEKREKQKKLSRLKNALLNDVQKHNSKDKQTLGDFLASLI